MCVCTNIDIVNRCGATVTLNNTYWQAPITVSAESTCTLSIQLDPSLPEQRRNPICQVRLVSIEIFLFAVLKKYCANYAVS